MEKTFNKTSKKNYPEYQQLNLPELDKDILAFWEAENIFKQSVSSREGKPAFTFYEGPPSANGSPGIHHVMARAIKDLICRYKTLKGFQVHRKGGWDTHGLPVELQVEKKLGITKDDIGKKISIADYNKECRTDVLKFKDQWDDLTQRMGYWVDLDNPYITFENDYIESVWNLLKRIHDKNLLYKGFSIQPYSPAAGTGLSSHELNLPGAYQNVKDTSCIAQFLIERNEKSAFLFENDSEEVFFLAWTTTPWTLPSNTALAVGKNIDYVKIKTFNSYTGIPISVILAKSLMGKYFPEENASLPFSEYEKGDKKIPFELLSAHKGRILEGLSYVQLLPYVQPPKPAFRVLIGDFVTTVDGTGIVHLAPTFGSDDFRIAQQNDIPPLMVKDEEGNDIPLVDKQGRFVKEMGEFAGRYVKNYTDDPDYVNVDIDICVKLKQENRAFKVEKYEHSYPHCWRTDKPVLYYPLDSWFIKTTAVRERMVELNKTINWKPASTGSGRFGNWLENLVDWNLSRSRFWGIPLPVWMTEDRKDHICIGSMEELRTEVEKAVKAGVMEQKVLDNWEEKLDLHKPFVDEIILVNDEGEAMTRESDLIDVWFDSGSMPFAQFHYPFENQEMFKQAFPADYIAEGVDQTRGWFFTLHAIAVMVEDKVAYKNVISNGLVLDKKGNKMSKRLGNGVDPFMTLDKYGADATRWYMITNAPPWENLKFNEAGIVEVQRRFFGTLYNTYKLFSLYANIDAFDFKENRLAVAGRPEIDRWIISLLNSLVKKVELHMDDYDPTPAMRAIEDFVVDNLSNWYVRLCRRRYWKGEMNTDKLSAYQTLYECLETVSKLMSPVAPFFADRLFRDLNGATGLEDSASVHLSDFPVWKEEEIDELLEGQMTLAQEISSLVHSIRKRKDVSIKIRQPLGKIMVPILDSEMKVQLENVKGLILSEVNVKELEYLTEDSNVLVKVAKPNFRILGQKAGKAMKELGAVIQQMDQDQISSLENNGNYLLKLSDQEWNLLLEEVEILSKDIPGWSVASNGKITVALDITLTEDLLNEGIAREFVNRIQNLRKELDFEITDKINVKVSQNPYWDIAINQFLPYICDETLALGLEVVENVENGAEIEINSEKGKILIEK